MTYKVYYTKQNKLNMRTQMLYGLTKMWNIKEKGEAQYFKIAKKSNF